LPFLYRYGKVFIQAWQVTDSTRILYTPINRIEQTMKQLTRITLDLYSHILNLIGSPIYFI